MMIPATVQSSLGFFFFFFFFLLLSSRLLICQVLSLGLRSVLGEFQGISLRHHSPSEICNSKVCFWSFFPWVKQALVPLVHPLETLFTVWWTAPEADVVRDLIPGWLSHSFIL